MQNKNNSTDTVPEKAAVNVPLEEEEPIPDVYPAIDNDLARDNIENDMTAADLQDF